MRNTATKNASQISSPLQNNLAVPDARFARHGNYDYTSSQERTPGTARLFFATSEEIWDAF